MSIMYFGITHCMNCGEPYRNGFECECTRKREQEKQEKLDLLLDMTVDEIKALKNLVKKEVREIEAKELREKIRKLEMQLGEQEYE